MTEEWTRLYDPLPQIRAALTGLDTETPYQVCCRWPRREDRGTTITVTAITNRQTDVSVVDQIAVQIDLWAEERDSIRALAPLVNGAVCGIGYRRDYAGDEEQITSAPGWQWRKTFRFGRRLDKRWGRLID